MSKIRVLFVDDDIRLLEGLRRNLHEKLDIVTATGAIEGLRALDREGPFPVMVTDQNMPKIDGIAFLDKVAEHFPDTIRIMLSGNPDQSILARAVNHVGIFRFLPKPCGAADLLKAIDDAYQEHERRHSEILQARQMVSGVINLLTDLMAAKIPTISCRAEQVLLWSRAADEALELKNGKELQIAAQLWPLVYVLLPSELIKRRLRGESMSPADRSHIAAAYMSASKLLNNVPGFANIAKMLLMACEGTDHADTSIEAELLHILIQIGLYIEPEKSQQAEKIAKQLLAVGKYNPAIVAALPGILAGSQSGIKADISTLAVFELGAGDLLLSDLKDDDDRLLLAAGQTVSKTMLERIKGLHAQGKVSARLRVARASSA